ncbi:MAG: tRNA pseudouridine(38-40) synthase TruA [Rickettsiales bacterium]|jgi:tRNA pseudouridine38-40 synthase|nr:tRNA pseudouridine(38-40) synthase TruA [Rickettsiales bacterium]
MTRYKLTLEYDGTTLIGWQENRHGDSVQSLLQDSIFKFAGERVVVVAAGRTDAGVHALGMVAHFDLTSPEPRLTPPETIMRALNFYLANSPVCVLNCEQVSDDFHARFSCLRRNSEYVILNRGASAVLDKNRVLWVARKLNVRAMRQAAAKLVGNHDFTSFRASECQAKSPIKTLDTVAIRTQGEYIVIGFSAQSFLHHQVRNMVGTLIEIGLGRDMDIDKIFAAKNRSAAGPTAPASGLYFVSAEY